MLSALMKTPTRAPSTIWRARVLDPPVLRATVTPVAARYRPAISASASFRLAATETTRPRGCAATGVLNAASTVMLDSTHCTTFLNAGADAILHDIYR